MPNDTFFDQTTCDRCHNSLDQGRILSWFKDQTICMDCSDKEEEIKNQLRKHDINPTSYEGCGYIPDTDDIIEQKRRDEKNGLYPEKWDDCN